MHPIHSIPRRQVAAIGTAHPPARAQQPETRLAGWKLRSRV
ncbi:predicted protein [Plenodomus lingam JN3]|uniref:Predicted protein n=1 Tax=Leptosphaeria maculans (strain JN3 / isolate v23.1.3 / race Av1-4-5-6-7-8) TaxID=985895 RepID=E4ZRY9_LEPMJ|nr:predicted protein [Plenodomus lingam JN3]CBX94169.1 predicted protein [Plenodomus lingam JN3]